MKGRELFVMNVGSHIWHMDTPQSDTDLFVAYAAPVYDILTGTVGKGSHFKQEGRTDRSEHEISVIVHKLLDGNVNFLWGIFSPIMLDGDAELLSELRDLAKRNFNKNTYHSIRGLAVKNIEKYIRGNKRKLSEEKLQKKRNIVGRTLDFGITFLQEGKIEFKPSRDNTLEGLEEKLADLQVAHDASSLPDAPLEGAEMLEWLYDLRAQEILSHEELVSTGTL